MISNMTYAYILRLAHILHTSCAHLAHILHTSCTHLAHIYIFDGFSILKVYLTLVACFLILSFVPQQLTIKPYCLQSIDSQCKCAISDRQMSLPTCRTIDSQAIDRQEPG